MKKSPYFSEGWRKTTNQIIINNKPYNNHILSIINRILTTMVGIPPTSIRLNSMNCSTRDQYHPPTICRSWSPNGETPHGDFPHLFVCENPGVSMKFHEIPWGIHRITIKLPFHMCFPMCFPHLCHIYAGWWFGTFGLFFHILGIS